MKKLLLFNLGFLIVFSTYSQTIPINPSQVQFKTIPEKIYENDSVHFVVIADFFILSQKVSVTNCKCL